jgi:hypothetical protein
MKAEVPYLSRLARQAVGQPVLRPPRQLFTGDIDVPVHSVSDLGSPPRQAVNAAPSSPRMALPPDGLGVGQPEPAATAGEADPVREAGSTAVEPAVAMPGWPDPAIPSAAASAPPDTPAPLPATPHRLGAGHLEVPEATVTGVADPDGTRPGALPMSLLSRGPRPGADAGQAPPPGSRVSSLREQPADRPGAAAHAPEIGQADRPAAPAGPHAAAPGSHVASVGPPAPAPGSRAASAEPGPALRAAPAGPPPSGLGPIAPAGSDQDHHPDGVRAAVARPTAARPGPPGPLGPQDAAPADRSREKPVPDRSNGLDPGLSTEPPAVRDLIPPLTAEPPRAEPPRAEPGQPLVPRRPRVSIGTIEVTIVPPTPTPTPVIHQIQPLARVTNRPSSAFAASAGADRLRHGFRRWYGTAQG